MDHSVVPTVAHARSDTYAEHGDSRELSQCLVQLGARLKDGLQCAGIVEASLLEMMLVPTCSKPARALLTSLHELPPLVPLLKETSDVFTHSGSTLPPSAQAYVDRCVVRASSLLAALRLFATHCNGPRKGAGRKTPMRRQLANIHCRAYTLSREIEHCVKAVEALRGVVST